MKELYNAFLDMEANFLPVVGPYIRKDAVNCCNTCKQISYLREHFLTEKLYTFFITPPPVSFLNKQECYTMHVQSKMTPRAQMPHTGYIRSAYLGSLYSRLSTSAPYDQILFGRLSIISGAAVNVGQQCCHF